MESSIEANIWGSSVSGERSSKSASRLLLLPPKATTSADPATAAGPPMASVKRKTIRYSARSVPKMTRRPGRNSHMTSAIFDRLMGGVPKITCSRER